MFVRSCIKTKLGRSLGSPRPACRDVLKRTAIAYNQKLAKAQDFGSMQ